MPAEPRRNSRKLTSEEDIELKRARGEISCAECRRLKLKCDKKLPCGSCVRRGCTTICPNGSLSAGQGTRFVLADTEQLHRKISEMSERIRQLEDALAIFQAGISNERHPLLRDELLSIKFGPEVRRTIDEENSRNAQSQTIDALGTLTVGVNGETKFIGRSGGTETLLMASDIQFEDEDLEVPCLEQELASLSLASPFGGTFQDMDVVLDKLERNLPPHPRAWALCEAYLEHFTFWFRPIKRDELIDEILTPIYRSINDPDKRSYFPSMPGDGERCPHRLAVLFFILAVGALVDLTLPACNVEAEKYFQFGKAALSLRSIFDSPEIETVQAVSIMAAYQSACSQRYTNDSAWAIISLSVKLAQGLGLHRDSSQWKLDTKIVNRRRNLFWEIVMFEALHCYSLGRPSTLSPHHIDCELAPDEEETIGEDGQRVPGFWAWKHRFASTIFMDMLDKLLRAKPPTYEVVLEMDRKIRQAELPKVKLYLTPDEDGYANPGACMRSYIMSQMRSICMLAIHRTFFAQALLDNRTNPLRSPYSPSFLSANRCACILVRSFLHHFERRPDLCGRFWTIWTHAFTAAMILAATVKWCPNATMAPSSLVELDLAIELFKKGAVSSPRARMALPHLIRLRDKAVKEYQDFRARRTSPNALDIQLKIGPEDDGGDKLAMFGGQTRVVSSKLLTRKRRQPSLKTTPTSNSSRNASVTSTENSHSAETSNSSTAPTRKSTLSSVEHFDDSPSPSASGSSPGDIPENLVDAFNEVHPTLVEYLSFFPSQVAMVDTSQPLVDPTSTAQAQGNASSSRNMPPNTTQPFSFPTQALMPQQMGSAYQPTNLPYPMTNSNPLGQTSAPMEVTATTVAGLTDLQGFPDDLMDEQWMDLMRDTGLFEGHPSLGFNPTPASIPNGVNQNVPYSHPQSHTVPMFL
ncbi:hypothetical protein K474DRAFT_1659611 [Panus rudis PR-1116 ss-1]|nr:hypothetical protein K474DRAFT_1659611 [Panus rudis PR-1116 ss-1]